MKPKWRGVLAVVAVGAGIIIYKATATRRDAAAPDAPTALTTNAASSVVLVADLGEAETSCGCGEIIREVRSAARKGVSVKEVDPEKSPTAASHYKALVMPTVLVMDGSGKELRRFEGEGADTIKAMKAELRRLAETKP